MKQNINHKKIWLEWVPIGICAVSILVCAFVFKQKWYKVLPTLNTLIILLLSARVDRRSFLIGGLNAAFYGIGFFTEGLYFSVINCLLVSMPLQLFSFFNWKKHADGNSTKLVRDVMNSTDQVIQGVKETTGIDLMSMLAGFVGGKVATAPAAVVACDEQPENEVEIVEEPTTKA